jgi:hypothetical protein
VPPRRNGTSTVPRRRECRLPPRWLPLAPAARRRVTSLIRDALVGHLAGNWRLSLICVFCRLPKRTQSRRCTVTTPPLHCTSITTATTRIPGIRAGLTIPGLRTDLRRHRYSQSVTRLDITHLVGALPLLWDKCRCRCRMVQMQVQSGTTPPTSSTTRRSSLVFTGQYWSSLATTGLHWPRLVLTGHDWSSLARLVFTGHDWSSLASTGLHWPLAITGHDWSSLARLVFTGHDRSSLASRFGTTWHMHVYHRGIFLCAVE